MRPSSRRSSPRGPAYFRLAEHTRRFRQHDESLMRAQYLVYDDDGAVIQTARDAISDLEKLFEADATGEDVPPPAR